MVFLKRYEFSKCNGTFFSERRKYIFLLKTSLDIFHAGLPDPKNIKSKVVTKGQILRKKKRPNNQRQLDDLIMKNVGNDENTAIEMMCTQLSQFKYRLNIKLST